MQDQFKKIIVREPSGIYWLAFVAAFIYYLKQATGFWMGALGFIKALLWPAFLIYKVFEFLKM